jgi:hypothetical protein
MEYWYENLWFIILQEGIFVIMVCTSTRTYDEEDIVVYFLKIRSENCKKVVFFDTLIILWK